MAVTAQPCARFVVIFMDDSNTRASAARHGTPFLNTAQAAHFLMTSQRTLERLRTRGGGPAYSKHGGQVRYLIDDLETWSSRNKHSGELPAPKPVSPCGP
jgi:hypothetical protein